MDSIQDVVDQNLTILMYPGGDVFIQTLLESSPNREAMMKFN